MEWVDPEDPTVIAEAELLGAAASIEAAAKKLEQLKPRAKPRVSGRSHACARAQRSHGSHCSHSLLHQLPAALNVDRQPCPDLGFSLV